MFNKLQQKWKVSGPQLVLILCTFAVTGSLTAFISRSITSWVGFDEQTLLIWKILLRLSILVFGYQVIILIVSFFFGQFKFFWNYEKKILTKMGFIKKMPSHSIIYKVAIFASGKGSNAEKIIEHFENHDQITISLIVCNRLGAGVFDVAKKHGIKSLLLEKNAFNDDQKFVQFLINEGITHIVLAGFLWKIPEYLIQAYPEKIINIHPALLPNFGGKGMYGNKVHEAVIASGEKESGITIHLVDEHYDHGKTIFQATVQVLDQETPESLASKIHQLEHKHFPSIVERWILGTK
jgi:formyltetrahydrofolate-dependent phosphoribosylglycinamide formyltransferase